MRRALSGVCALLMDGEGFASASRSSRKVIVGRGADVIQCYGN